MTYQNILVKTEGAVGIVTLNRPQALNALNSPMMDELATAMDGLLQAAGDDKTNM